MKENQENKEETATSITEMSKEELVAAYEALFRSAAQVNDEDAYSLAQPSPYRFVPSMLSSNTGMQK